MTWIESDPANDRTIYGIRPHRRMTQREHDLAKRAAEGLTLSPAVLAELIGASQADTP